MSEQLIKIDSEVTSKEVVNMINRAPDKYSDAVEKWLYSTRKSFVGNEKTDGSFRKKILRKKNVRGQNWSLKVARLFKGRVEKGTNINRKLEMGVFYNNRKKIHEVLESFQDDKTISGSKYMPIPIYKNLNISALSKTYIVFKNKMRSNSLFLVRDAENILYFDKKGNKDLLFVGIKKINVGKQFDFKGDFEKKVPSFQEKFRKMITTTTDKING